MFISSMCVCVCVINGFSLFCFYCLPYKSNENKFHAGKTNQIKVIKNISKIFLHDSLYFLLFNHSNECDTETCFLLFNI